MGLFRKLIRATPKEELKGISLDLNQPFWELEGKTDFPSLLRALSRFLPDGCVLYFEGGSPRGKLLEFIESHRIEEQTHVAIGTLWPRPRRCHIPATNRNIRELASLAEHVAEPELAIHFHVYRNGEILLEWHDAFTQPMLLSGSLKEEKIGTLAKDLKMKITKWKNASEQGAAADPEE